MVHFYDWFIQGFCHIFFVNININLNIIRKDVSFAIYCLYLNHFWKKSCIFIISLKTKKHLPKHIFVMTTLLNLLWVYDRSVLLSHDCNFHELLKHNFWNLSFWIVIKFNFILERTHNKDNSKRTTSSTNFPSRFVFRGFLFFFYKQHIVNSLVNHFLKIKVGISSSYSINSHIKTNWWAGPKKICM